MSSLCVGVAADHGGFELKALITESLRRHGVENDMNVLCFGGKVIGTGVALINVFLIARCTGAPRHKRRLAKVQALKKGNLKS